MSAPAAALWFAVFLRCGAPDADGRTPCAYQVYEHRPFATSAQCAEAIPELRAGLPGGAPGFDAFCMEAGSPVLEQILSTLGPEA